MNGIDMAPPQEDLLKNFFQTSLLFGLIDKSNPAYLKPIGFDIANRFFSKMKQSMNEFNQGFSSKQKEEQRKALLNIKSAIKNVEMTESPDNLARADEFEDIKKIFRKVMDEHAKRLQLVDKNVQTKPALLIDIDKMDDETLEKLMVLLLSGENPSSQNSHLKTFIEKYDWSFIGGHYSKHYSVTDRSSGKKLVITVENRQGVARQAEERLRHKIPGGFVPNQWVKQVRGGVPVKGQVRPVKISRTIAVTDFYPKGSLEKLAQQAKNEPVPVQSLIHFANQMANMMIVIGNSGYFFTDPKLSKWLVDEKDRLKLTGSRSYVKAENGQYQFDNKKSTQERRMLSSVLEIPEAKKSSINVAQAHAMLLGRNIYQCVTSEALPLRSLKDSDFDKPGLNDNPALKYIISQLTQKEPSERMSMENAKVRLKHYDIYNKHHQLFERLESLGAGPHDKGMNDYIKTKLQALTDAKSDDKEHEIVSDMQRLADKLSKGMNAHVVQLIKRYKADAKEIFSIGMRRKADNIASAFGDIPVESRYQTSTYEGKDAKKLEQAIGQERHWWRWRQKNNKKDDTNATKSHKAFKAALNKVKNGAGEDSQQDNVLNKELKK